MVHQKEEARGSRQSVEWPVGQEVKTAASHAVNVGSTPARVTKQAEPAYTARRFARSGRAVFLGGTVEEISRFVRDVFFSSWFICLKVNPRGFRQ